VSRAFELPDYEYPTPFIVKNTFIDTPITRPLSLDEFIRERRVVSCPPDAQPQTEPETQAIVATELSEAVTTSAAMFANAAAGAASVAAATVRGWWTPGEDNTSAGSFRDMSQMLPQAMVPQPVPHVLRLAEAITETEVGSAELPTIGSLGHQLGTCKPCAFFHKRGCANAAQCIFCHLCDPSEKKRRQKEKIEQIREMRRCAKMSL